MIDSKSIMLNVLELHNDSNKWNESSFEKIKRISNTKVGTVGQDFIEALCKTLSYQCKFPLNPKGERATQSPWDIEINEIKFELKTATEDIGGAFQFNHIRYHRPYDGVICLGVSPEEIHFNMWSKSEIVTGKAGNLVSMEKGANASYKLTKRPRTLNNIDQFSAIFSTFERKYKASQ
jgi:hypothetical protein